MPIPLSIPKQPPAEPAFDYEALFGLGLDRLKVLAGDVWTDHNVHDPGITTLELLAYALTDLSYRASFPVADLLASEDGDPACARNQFFTARQILPNRPLTAADYRKLLIDLKGVKNAWVRPTTETYYADTLRGVLLREAPEAATGVVPVNVRGLYRVLLEFMDDVTMGERPAIVASARALLHANRNLCEDFVGFDPVDVQPFALCAELELTPEADVAAVHAEILFRVQQYLAPPVNQYSLTEMLARRRADGSAYGAEEIFDGPVLAHGFIDDEELARAELPTEIRLSDVVSIIMDIAPVRAVRDIVVNPASPATAPENRWRVPVSPGCQALLDRDASRLVFYKRGMPFVAAPERVAGYWERLAGTAVARVETPQALDFDVPLARPRRLSDYYSVQNHFPDVYGLGEVGLPGGADERRKVLAYQLKGYLLLFDQLMADYCAQLGHVCGLFSFDPAAPGRTYHHRAVDSFADFEKIYGVTGTDIAAAVAARVDDPEVEADRRNRFLDHLIARFGEQFQEFAQLMRSEFGSTAASMVRYKCEFLRDYPAISSERALAYDYSLQGDEDLWNSANVSGQERRLARLLGMPRPERRNLGEIAYDIYTEIDSTPGDEFRFRVRDKDTGKIVLSASTHYATPEAARREMRVAIHFASLPSGYQRNRAADGRHYFNVVDATGEVIARRIEYFQTAEAMEAAIENLLEYLRERYSEEGMYLIENLLLRPVEGDDPLLPICPDPNCTECADEDPYSYRVHIVLPAYAGRFEDMEFRRWAERIIREETPAHIQPKICWISAEDMAALEKLYRDWIYLRAGRETASRREKLTDFIGKLFQIKNVYPAQRLRDCDAEEGQEKFIVGRTAVGTMDEPENGV